MSQAIDPTAIRPPSQPRSGETREIVGPEDRPTTSLTRAIHGSGVVRLAAMAGVLPVLAVVPVWVEGWSVAGPHVAHLFALAVAGVIGGVMLLTDRRGRERAMPKTRADAGYALLLTGAGGLTVLLGARLFSAGGIAALIGMAVAAVIALGLLVQAVRVWRRDRSVRAATAGVISLSDAYRRPLPPVESIDGLRARRERVGRAAAEWNNAEARLDEYLRGHTRMITLASGLASAGPLIPIIALLASESPWAWLGGVLLVLATVAGVAGGIAFGRALDPNTRRRPTLAVGAGWTVAAVGLLLAWLSTATIGGVPSAVWPIGVAGLAITLAAAWVGGRLAVQTALLQQRLGSPVALSYLIDALDAKDAEVRDAAHRSLQRLTGHGFPAAARPWRTWLLHQLEAGEPLTPDA